MIKKNKNTILIVTLVILIIFAFIYLVYRNYQYTKVLESFGNNSQSSLSTYYTNNVDSDDYGYAGENPNYVHDALNNPSSVNLNVFDQSLLKSIQKMVIDQEQNSSNEVLYNDYDNISKNLVNQIINRKFTNSYHKIVSTNPNQRDVGWSGTWKVKPPTDNAIVNSNSIIICNFYQLNDKLIISLSQSVHKNTSSNYQFYEKLDTDNDFCPNNLFLGMAQLNASRSSFILTDIYCNSFPDPSGSGTTHFMKNNLTGKLFLTKEEVMNYSGYTKSSINTSNINKLNFPFVVFFSTNPSDTDGSTNANVFIVVKEKAYDIDSTKYPFNSDFLMKGTNFVNPSSILEPSQYVYEEDPVCPPGSNTCLTRSFGTYDASYDQRGYNACSTKVNEKDGSCDPNIAPVCITFTPPKNADVNNSIPKRCTPSNTVTILENMNYNAAMQLTQLGGSNSNSLKICKHLEYISNKLYNTTIICYIKNIGDVRTLSYEYYGIHTQQNNLSTQYDMMDTLLNGTEKNPGLLSKYRTLMSLGAGNLNAETLNALSFTNILEKMDDILADGSPLYVDSINRLASNAIDRYYKIYGKKYSSRTTKSTGLPLLWNFNVNNTTNMLNSCVSYLSTSNVYTSTVKNAEFSSDGTTRLSLYSGGMQQQIIFENSRVIKNNPKFYAITANLRTNTQLYLIPSDEMDGFTSNASILKLRPYPEENGKWLIMGLNISDTKNLDKQIKDMVESFKYDEEDYGGYYDIQYPL
jgi:hypothetical protein